jgi:hypothetical protein
VGQAPAALAITPDGAYVYVVSSKEIQNTIGEPFLEPKNILHTVGNFQWKQGSVTFSLILQPEDVRTILSLYHSPQSIAS